MTIDDRLNLRDNIMKIVTVIVSKICQTFSRTPEPSSQKHTDADRWRRCNRELISSILHPGARNTPHSFQNTPTIFPYCFRFAIV